jgi:hypothetical protein
VVLCFFWYASRSPIPIRVETAQPAVEKLEIKPPRVRKLTRQYSLWVLHFTCFTFLTTGLYNEKWFIINASSSFIPFPDSHPQILIWMTRGPDFYSWKYYIVGICVHQWLQCNRLLRTIHVYHLTVDRGWDSGMAYLGLLCYCHSQGCTEDVSKGCGHTWRLNSYDCWQELSSLRAVRARSVVTWSFSIREGTWKEPESASKVKVKSFVS